MTLEFKHQSAYGKARYYPQNLPAKAIVGITGRKCLNHEELGALRAAGFIVSIIQTQEVLP